MENKFKINPETGTVNCNKCWNNNVALPHECSGNNYFDFFWSCEDNLR